MLIRDFLPLVMFLFSKGWHWLSTTRFVLSAAEHCVRIFFVRTLMIIVTYIRFIEIFYLFVNFSYLTIVLDKIRLDKLRNLRGFTRQRRQGAACLVPLFCECTSTITFRRRTTRCFVVSANVGCVIVCGRPWTGKYFIEVKYEF